MGFYLQKSIKVGDLSFSFSNTGIGISGRTGGLKIGTGPKVYYIYIGRNGFHYKQIVGNINDITLQNETNDLDTAPEYNLKDIGNDNVNFIIDSSLDSIIQELNDKAEISLNLVALIIGILLCFIDTYAVLVYLMIAPIAYVLNKKLKTIYIIYDIEKDKENELQQFYDSFDEIINSSKKWEPITSTMLNSNYERKINAGANNLLKRFHTTIRYYMPKYITTNIQVPLVFVDGKNLFFFPEKILIIDRKKFRTLDYNELKVNFRNIQFIETEAIPQDTEIIGKRWKYVNKNGGQDNRFKNNIQYPIVKYSELRFSSDSDIDLDGVIHLSKPNTGQKLIMALKEKDDSSHSY